MFGANGANMSSVPEHRLNRLAAIVEFSEDAIIGKDIDGIITEWNQGARQLYGYAADEVIGKPVSLLIPPDVADDFPQIMQKIRRGESIVHYETVRKTKDGVRVEVSVSVSPIRDEVGKIVGAAAIARDISERKRQSRKLIEAQEQERMRIARELHDDINQRIAMLGIKLDVFQQGLPNHGGKFRGRLDELRQLAAEIGTEVQGISHRLHSSKLDYLGLVAACKSFCREVADVQKMEVNFAAENIPPTLSQEVSLCLFRVLQESLSNAIKHSAAQRFEVQLHRTSNEIQLTVRDHGIGFDAGEAIASRGLGLISMRERVSAVNGVMVIASKPMEGTEITVRVPVAARAESKAISGAA